MNKARFRLSTLAIFLFLQPCELFGQEFSNLILKPDHESVHYDQATVYGKITIKHTSDINSGLITRYAGLVKIYRWNNQLVVTQIVNGMPIETQGDWEPVKSYEPSFVLLGFNQTQTLQNPDAGGWVPIETLPPGQYKVQFNVVAQRVNAQGFPMENLKLWRYQNLFEMRSSPGGGTNPPID